MMLYKIMLTMLIFSVVNAGLNASGLYLTKLPEQQSAVTQAQVVDLTTTVGNAQSNPWTALAVLGTVFRFLMDMALGLLTVLPMLLAFGVPMWLALMIQTPIWLILAWGVYEMWTGHSSKMQD